MAIRAFAIVNDLGVLFVDHQLLIFPRRAKAQRKLTRLNADDFQSAYFDEARIEVVSIGRTKGTTKKGTK